MCVCVCVVGQMDGDKKKQIKNQQCFKITYPTVKIKAADGSE